MGLSTFLNGRPPTRGLIWLSLSEIAVIQANTATSDAGGGASWVWNAAGTVHCRIDPLGGGGSRLVGGAIDERSTHMVTTPPGTNISLTNRIVVQGRGTFEVTLVRERTAERSNVCEVMQVDP